MPTTITNAALEGQDGVFATAERAISFYRETRARKLTVTRMLNQLIKAEDRTFGGRTLDGFEEMCRRADIRIASDRENGVFSDPVTRFFGDGLADRVVSADTFVYAPALFPEYIERQIRAAQLQEDQLAAIVGETIDYEGSGYRQITLEETTAGSGTNADLRRLSRTVQGTELPVLGLKLAEREVRGYKYGAQMPVSYEFFRESKMGVEALGKKIQQIAIQARRDRTSDLMDVAVNGDGSTAGACRNYNLTALDAAAVAGGPMTYKAFMNLVLSFNWYQDEQYQLDTIVGNQASMLAFVTMTGVPNISPFALLSLIQGGTQTVNLKFPDNFIRAVNLVVVSDAPALTLICLDRKQALVEGIQAGSQIVEQDKIINKQIQLTTMSETIAHAVAIPNARATVNLNA